MGQGYFAQIIFMTSGDVFLQGGFQGYWISFPIGMFQRPQPKLADMSSEQAVPTWFVNAAVVFTSWLLMITWGKLLLAADLADSRNFQKNACLCWAFY